MYTGGDSEEKGEKALKELIHLCQDVYRTGEWPEHFLQTIPIPLKKEAMQ